MAQICESLSRHKPITIRLNNPSCVVRSVVCGPAAGEADAPEQHLQSRLVSL